jgi:hypothetical protein
MSGGVEDVLFEDLTSTSESGIRISAELLRGGFVRNVTFRNLTFDWNVLLKKTFLLEVRVRRVRRERERERERERAGPGVGGKEEREEKKGEARQVFLAFFLSSFFSFPWLIFLPISLHNDQRLSRRTQTAGRSRNALAARYRP